jgi:tetratricopeptide (TPR) repeat protein
MNIGVALNRLQRFAEAAEILEPTVASMQRTLGITHATTLSGVDALAGALVGLGDTERGAALLEEALAARKQAGDLDSLETVQAANNLGFNYLGRELFEDAARHLTFALEGQKRLAPSHPNVVPMAINLGRALRGLRRYDESCAALRDGLEWFRATGTAEDVRWFTLTEGLALSERGAGRFEAAEPLYQALFTHLEAHLGASHDATAALRTRIADFYDEWKRPESAALWRERE